MFLHPLVAEENGQVGVTNGLNIDNIILAYRYGIFPWMEVDGFFFWFSTRPRLILKPEKIKIAKSMRSTFNRNKFELRVDSHFTGVMEGCAEVCNHNDSSTWISDAFIEKYSELHNKGYAHSFEAWNGDKLVGGLYGISLGKIFYGESMFARETNASKFALICLARYLEKQGYQLIDCQQDSPHLRSMGGELISLESFMKVLRQNIFIDDQPGSWTTSVNKTYHEICSLS